MLCFNDRITPAFYGLKTSANRMDTFKCFEAGHLGLMNNLTPHFFYEPAKATGKPFFEIDNLNDLPKAVLLVCYMDMDMGELESKCNDKEVKGIVIAGSGNVSSNQCRLGGISLLTLGYLTLGHIFRLLFQLLGARKRCRRAPQDSLSSAHLYTLIRKPLFFRAFARSKP